VCVETVCKFHLKKSICLFTVPLDGQPKEQKGNNSNNSSSNNNNNNNKKKKKKKKKKW